MTSAPFATPLLFTGGRGRSRSGDGEAATEAARVAQNGSDHAFAPDDGDRWNAIRHAHGAIAPMFWGARIPIEEACKAIRVDCFVVRGRAERPVTGEGRRRPDVELYLRFAAAAGTRP